MDFKNLPEWVIWAFGGVGIPVVGFFIKKLLGKDSDTKSSNENNIQIQNSPSINVNVGTTNETKNAPSLSKSPKKKFLTTEGAKQDARILFVDDDTRFKMVKILKDAGWLNVEIKKDIHIDDNLLKSADLVFVDINGVGKKMGFNNEGLGLSSAICEKYPDKYVVIYSSQKDGDRFDEAIRKADDKLYKHADAYQFEKCINNLLL